MHYSPEPLDTGQMWCMCQCKYPTWTDGALSCQFSGSKPVWFLHVLMWEQHRYQLSGFRAGEWVSHVLPLVRFTQAAPSSKQTEYFQQGEHGWCKLSPAVVYTWERTGFICSRGKTPFLCEDLVSPCTFEFPTWSWNYCLRSLYNLDCNNYIYLKNAFKYGQSFNFVYFLKNHICKETAELKCI